LSRENKLFLFLAVLFSVAFILLIYRAYIIQVVRHEKLQDYSSSNDEVIKTVRGKRGSIFDRNGEPLVISEAKIDIAVDPKGIIEKDEMAVVLSKITGTDTKKTYETLNKKGRFYFIKKNAEYEVVKAVKDYKNSIKKSIRELKLSKKTDAPEYLKLNNILKDLGHVIFYEGYKRSYPQGRMLANVLGFVQKNEDVGLEGIEMAYDKFLAGKERKIRRLTIPSTGESILEIDKEIDTDPSADIYLTIDSRIQFIAEEELTAMMEKTKAVLGAVVVMEPATGKIIAMANYPSYEPENYFNFSPKERRNFAIANLFEPGSTFKVFSILGVINENLAKPGELINGENGRFMFGRKWVRDSHPNQMMTIRDVVVKSSNIGTIKLADRLSKEQLYNYFTMFGFGQKTKINIPGESSTRIRPYSEWYPIDKGTISFGQGISTNMVQLTRAYSTIYNGGVLWQPVLVDKIVNPVDGRIVFQTVPEPKRITFNYNSDKKMVSMLEGVVDEGTAKTAALRGIKVGGKTGTSQIFDFKTKKYSSEKVVCSFIGAVPSNDPAFVIMVLIEQPEGREFGGTIAAPVFKRIAERSLPIQGIFVEKKESERYVIPDLAVTDITGESVESDPNSQKDTPSSMEYVKVPSFLKSDTAKALESANRAGLDILFSGGVAGKVVKQYPEPGKFVPFGTVITLQTEELTNENE